MNTRIFIFLLISSLGACLPASNFGTGVDPVLGPPTITLSSLSDLNTNDDPIVVSLAASESIQAPTSGDFTCTNCTITNISGSGAFYTLDVNPVAQGAVAVQLDEASVSDLFGNENLVASNELDFIFDDEEPAAVAGVSPFTSAQLNSLDVTVSGTCEVDAVVLIDGDIDLEPEDLPVAVSCMAGFFSETITLVEEDVGQDLSLSQVDLAGNVSPEVLVTYTALSNAPGQLLGAYDHTCATMSDGTARCWGLNSNGQLGDNTIVQKTVPTPFAMGAFTGGLSALDVGHGHTCAIDGTGELLCWGSDEYGQLGNGGAGEDDVLAPAVVDSNAVHVALGADHSCFLNASDNVLCSGRNNVGQQGVALGTTQHDDFTQIGSLSNVTRLAVGDNHNCVLNNLGVFCWGANDSGQLGIDVALPGAATFTPTQVQEFVSGGPNVNLSDVEEIAAGDDFSCALKSDNTVWCWGENAFGQLGNNDLTGTDSSVAVQVTGLANAISIHVGGNHACAGLAAPAGSFMCWGDNNQGQLGDQTLTNRYAPVDVLTPGGTADLVGATSVVLGREHSCFKLSFGTVVCVGKNAVGQLGNGLTADSDEFVVTDFAP